MPLKPQHLISFFLFLALVAGLVGCGGEASAPVPITTVVLSGRVAPAVLARTRQISANGDFYLLAVNAQGETQSSKINTSGGFLLPLSRDRWRLMLVKETQTGLQLKQPLVFPMGQNNLSASFLPLDFTLGQDFKPFGDAASFSLGDLTPDNQGFLTPQHNPLKNLLDHNNKPLFEAQALPAELLLSQKNLEAASRALLNPAAAPGNQPPQAGQNQPPEGTVGAPFQFLFSGTDPEGAPVSFALSGVLPAGLTFTGAGLDGVPEETISTSLQLTLSDGQNTVTQTLSLTVQAAPPPANAPPMFLFASPPPAQQGVAYAFLFSVSDTDNLNVVITLEGMPPPGLKLQQGLLSGTPQKSGDYPMVVNATDGANTVSTSVTISVAPAPPPNLPPVLLTQSLPQGQVGVDYSASFSATDPENTPLVFGLAGTLPSGLVPGETLLVGVPSQSGLFEIILTVSDGVNTVQQPLSLEILPAPQTGVAAVSPPP